jgi:hypothetical protein
MTTAIFILSLFMGQPTFEVSFGFGGISIDSADQPKINSNMAFAASYRTPIQPGWHFGTSLIFNSYSGDETYHVGPGLVMADAMVYRVIPMEELTLYLGGGAGLAYMFSYRNFTEETIGMPAGRYEYDTLGILVGLHGMMMYRLNNYVNGGLSLRYYSGYYLDNCWEGPEQDCRGTDQKMQNWIVGLFLNFIY